MVTGDGTPHLILEKSAATSYIEKLDVNTLGIFSCQVNDHNHTAKLTKA